MAGTAPLLYLAAGAATLGTALLPRLLGRVPVSMPMLFLGAGALMWVVLDLPPVDPVGNHVLALHLTEVCVIISLMGAGLAIDRPVSLKGWATTWRLLGITMPLSMLGVALLGWAVLGLGLAASLLLAAVLAPTDPVLATEVQVDEPSSDTPDDEARFGVTSEAGLNDGLAFPFVHAAVAISLVGAGPSEWLGHWLAVDVLWRIAIGVLVGLLTGLALRTLFFRAQVEALRLAEHAEGFVALAATFLAYGATEVVNGYGFLAVFVCACTIRTGERSHGYHRVLHQYVDGVERILVVVILVLLGGAATTGVLDGLTWAEVGLVAAFLLVVRPVSGLLGLVGGCTGPRERGIVSFFGVRGVGSLFYIAYATGNGDFADADALWRVVCLAVIGSIILHGVTATPAMRMLDHAVRFRKHP